MKQYGYLLFLIYYYLLSLGFFEDRVAGDIYEDFDPSSQFFSLKDKPWIRLNE